MKKLIVLLISWLSVYNLAYADSSIEIKAVNKRVSQIEKNKNSLNTLELKLDTGELEASPPEVRYYYKPDNLELVMLQVSVGHEIFVTRYSYYFNNNHLIKYLKEMLHHPDSPAKQAVIFKGDGTILWKNIDEPVITGSRVIELFKSNMDTLKAYSRY